MNENVLFQNTLFGIQRTLALYFIFRIVFLTNNNPGWQTLNFPTYFPSIFIDSQSDRGADVSGGGEKNCINLFISFSLF